MKTLSFQLGHKVDTTERPPVVCQLERDGHARQVGAVDRSRQRRPLPSLPDADGRAAVGGRSAPTAHRQRVGVALELPTRQWSRSNCRYSSWAVTLAANTRYGDKAGRKRCAVSSSGTAPTVTASTWPIVWQRTRPRATLPSRHCAANTPGSSSPTATKVRHSISSST